MYVEEERTCSTSHGHGSETVVEDNDEYRSYDDKDYNHDSSTEHLHTWYRSPAGGGADASGLSSSVSLKKTARDTQFFKRIRRSGWMLDVVQVDYYLDGDRRNVEVKNAEDYKAFPSFNDKNPLFV